MRRFKRRELVRIGARDILGLADLATTTRELSMLAGACMEVALEAVLSDLTAKHGAPTGRESGEPVEFAVIGMGKVGAGELNYSSDIDVIFVTSEWDATLPDAGRAVPGSGLDAETVIRGSPAVIEGIPTTRAVVRLARRHAVEMPITQAVYDVLFEKKTPLAAITELMSRPPRAEEPS